MDYSGDDFYCDVALKGIIPIKKEYESEDVLAYHHTKPYWPVHIIVVPKKHIRSLEELSKETAILREIVEVLVVLSEKMNNEHGGARILTNAGKYQDSKHLHWHINSGEPIK